MQNSIVVVSLMVSTAAWASPAPVVGGTAVKPGDWPDVVAVLGPGGQCTGTLVAPDVVLTAGHCADIQPAMVVANTVDYGVEHAGEWIPVKWTRAYPKWEHSYDVAVVMLDHVAKPRPRPIATACLANRALAGARPVTVIGFGLVTPSGTDDNTALHSAAVPILDPTCAAAPGCEPAVQPGGEFSAGGRGTDSCMGDSGGPAMLDGPGGPALVGVVSRGLALDGTPCGNGGVYVRADKVVAWIERVTGRDVERAACGGAADDPEVAPVEDDGGCAAAGGAQLGVGLLLIAVWRRRATRGGGGRPDRCGPVVRAEARPAVLAAGAGTPSDVGGPPAVAGPVTADPLDRGSGGAARLA